VDASPSPRRRVLDLYTSSAAARLYARLKLMILPLREAADALPRRGVILDMGCGFGFVANYLSFDSPERTIIANDPATSRIAVAQRTVGSRRNLEFVAMDSRHITRVDFDGICVVDVLHHVPYVEQQALINDLFAKLRPGGRLFIRETDRRLAIRYFLFNCALENLLYAGQEKTRFRPRDEWASMLEHAGFQIERVTGDPWWFPYTVCLFVCHKPV
jgi:2-polyprenyl-3-methyl-5-hydroxy-6-metoxy-1,4-benzoquinol methylase